MQIALVAAVEIDARVEPVRSEIIGVNLPYFAVFAHSGLERLAMRFREQLGPAIIAGHGLGQAVDQLPAGSNISPSPT